MLAALVLCCLLAGSAAALRGDPLVDFTARADRAVAGAALRPAFGAATPTECAAACLAAGPTCVAFTYAPGRAAGCELEQYTIHYTVAPAPGTTYYLRCIERRDEPAGRVVRTHLTTPVANVVLRPGSPLHAAFSTNIAYLLDNYDADDVLYWFRKRAGRPAPGASHGWDAGLKGSIAGLVLMGAGGTLRWREHDGLRAMLNAIVDGIAACQERDGYAMAYERNMTTYRENPNYVLSWLTHGLIEAAIAGHARALDIIRAHLDWFNYCEYLPEFLPADDFTWPQPVPDIGTGHQVYLIYQGMIHNTRLAAQTPRGRRRDVELIETLYQEDWWLRELLAGNKTAIWRRMYPHNYEVTAFEAYLDMYLLTGNQTYLNATLSAWELFYRNWIHVGGSMAINGT